MNESSSTKQLLLAACITMIEDRISTNMNILDSISESMIGETKSSAGDKFETSRAMLQADQNRYKAIIIQAKEIRQKLNTLSLVPAEIVREGSLILTTGVNYFISVPLGKIKVQDKLYYAISTASPIGNKLVGQSIGASVAFNGNSFKILKIL